MNLVLDASVTLSWLPADGLQLARRHHLSSYDASCLELALRNGLPLETLDIALAKAANKTGTRRFNPAGL